MGITYKLHHAHGRPTTPSQSWFNGEVVVTNAQAVPRIGDTIELNGINYDVILVWHVVHAQARNGDDLKHNPLPSGEAVDIIVRVK